MRETRTPLVRQVWARIDWKSEPVSAKDCIEFCSILAQEHVPVASSRVGLNSARPSGLIRALSMACGEYKRLQEIACNISLTPEEQEAITAHEQNVEKGIRELLSPYNVVPVFQGDPRGATVKLQVPSGRTNDWGREGICVPWS